jgi:hypothetical protein
MLLIENTSLPNRYELTITAVFKYAKIEYCTIE